MNDLERAVVEAARKVCDHATNLDEWVYPLRRAVVELDQWEVVRSDPTGHHPIDPSRCRNGLDERCSPQDCVIDHIAEWRSSR